MDGRPPVYSPAFGSASMPSPYPASAAPFYPTNMQVNALLSPPQYPMAPPGMPVPYGYSAASPPVAPPFAGYSPCGAPYGPPNNFIGYVFQPTSDEIADNKMEVLYSPISDRYCRPTAPDTAIQGWKAGLFSLINVIQRTEPDRNLSYLSRVPGSENGRVEWHFDLKGHRVKTIGVHLSRKVLQYGAVRVFLLSDQQQCEVPSFNEKMDKTKDKSKDSSKAKDKEKLKEKIKVSQKFKELRGATKFSIVAELSGGSGGESWKAAQLLSHERSDKQPPFLVIVKME